MSPTIRVLRRACLVLLLGLYSGLFAEAFLRVLSPQALLPRYVTAGPGGVRGNIPGARYRHETPEVDVAYRINAQGMRDDRVFGPEPDAGTCRIALFGDSFFMGYELELPDTVAARLEHHLRLRGVAAEVLNFAVSGFGTAEMRRSLEATGLGFDPDLVIFQWHATDPEDNARSDLWRLDHEQLVPGRPSFLPSIALQDRLMAWPLYRMLNDHSHLYAFLREAAGTAVKQLALSLSPARSEGAEPSARIRGAGPGALALSAALLQAVRAEVEGAGRGFLLVEIPERVSRTSFASTLDRLPPRALDAIAVLTPVDAFAQAASPDRKLYFERGHGHLTPFAADLLASLIAQRALGLLSGRSCPAALPDRLAGARPE